MKFLLSGDSELIPGLAETAQIRIVLTEWHRFSTVASRHKNQMRALPKNEEAKKKKNISKHEDSLVRKLVLR